MNFNENELAGFDADAARDQLAAFTALMSSPGVRAIANESLSSQQLVALDHLTFDLVHRLVEAPSGAVIGCEFDADVTPANTWASVAGQA